MDDFMCGKEAYWIQLNNPYLTVMQDNYFHVYYLLP